MALFMVTPLADNYDKIKDTISRSISDEDFYVIQHKAGFLVRSNLTSMELSFALEISTPDRSPTDMGPAMVTSITSYYGRAAVDMWEWMKSRMER